MSATPLDLTNADGLQLLTLAEVELCSTLRLLPRPYLVIKETLLREAERLGTLRRAQARLLLRMDVNKTGKIYDYFVSTGLINPNPKTLPRSDEGLKADDM